MNKSEAATESNKYFDFAHPESGEEVVISGIAGRFAESSNVEELKDNLFNRKDCVTDDFRRWKSDNPEIPQRTGKINNIQKFDALFFGIHSKQAHAMDPMSRMLLEHTYEAIIDAGVNPQDLSGTNTGVFIGVGFCESEKSFFYDNSMINGFGVVGCNKSTWANRISFCLNLSGPSYNIEAACSSSLHAIEHAYKAIRSEECDYAIVCGSNLCLNPNISLHFNRLGVLSKDGRSRCFDQDATGFARSEAAVVAFLQKAKNAKRIYATVCHAKTNCDGYKEEGIMFPSSKMQSTLFRELYNECGVPTTSVSYVEAHGTGTTVGDVEEANAIDSVFTKNRTNSLLVGSLKSNMGHAEAASGLCSVVKAIISMESSLIPPNLNFNRPRKEIKALMEGRIKIVTETTPLDGEYIGINSSGFGGTNAHVLLKSNPKKKVNNGLPNDDLPRLVVVSGRTEEAVIAILNDIKNRSVDVEYIRLLHDIYLKNIPKHLYRGYTITGFQKFNKQIQEIEHFSGMKRPIFFVFSGMGSQSLGMGQALMKFPIFAKALQKCDEVLKPYKLNIYKIFSDNDKTIFDNILHSFVGISAFQIGLMDLLTSVGIVPDYIIGHSFGELGCAYADGCLTAEEMILAAYWRGRVSIEEKIMYGSMAAVGLGYKDITKLCPPDVDVACHNGPQNSTISGPAESVKIFIKKLQEMNIFVQEVSCCNIPYHSRYVEAAGKKFLAQLKNAIPVAKPRSKKWLSTSVPRNEWSSSAAQFSSSEYHANNFMKPVLFEEMLDLIPNNAVTIEIAPHGLLQAILRKSLQPTVTNIVLNQRDHEDNLAVFLRGLGKLYNTGVQLDLSKLYPHVEYPVSRGTPMISPLIRWEHSYDWYVTSYKVEEKINSGDQMIEISIQDEHFQYLQGHMIDGRNLFPVTGYLCLVWETMGRNIGQLYTEVSVIFEDVKIIRATNIPKEGKVVMTVMIKKGSGKFEIIESNDVIVTGIINIAKNLSRDKELLDLIKDNNDEEEEELNEEDIYKELMLRGYQYSGIFRSMHSASVSASKGHIEWKQNWVAFIDNILQMKILSLDNRDLLAPIGIRKLVIDVETHQKYLESITNDKQSQNHLISDIPIRLFKQIDVIVAPGIEISNTRFHTITRKRSTNHPIIEEYRFIAYRDKKEMSLRKVLTLSMHITLENIPVRNVKTIELVDDKDNISAEELVSPILSDILSKLPSIQANVNVVAPPNKFHKQDIPKEITVTKLNNRELNSSSLLAVGSCLLTKEKKNNLKELLQSTISGAFILSREKTFTPLDSSILQEFQLVMNFNG
ncbi:fatty acid synthase-like [Polistes fuscatus]|uniref:fatty acid synthase-like n=1 Tax=Polistes fuscatus TaxID=30207 RepID=UPI001CA7DEB7|nr:fatty acid synthase-like [Polistes fuscatus]